MRALAVLTLFSLLAQRPAYRTVSLVLPHALREGETATLVLKVGVVPRGAEIVVKTASGQLLGVISPHGVPAGHELGTCPVPLPADAIAGRRVSVRISVDLYRSQRAPTKQEVRGVRVGVAVATRR